LQSAFAVSAATKGLQLLLECPADAWVHTDRNLLERIVRNLLENAVKYTDAGWVAIKVQRQGNHYRLSIADTGCGIAEDERARVFEEFYQIGNAARDRRCGLGLGLSIVMRLSELLGLALQMHSRVGQGTLFSLELLKTASLAACEHPPDTCRQVLPPRARVLIVDDEETVLDAMRALLEEMGCSVATATHTDAAVADIESQTPDLLISDFRLPGPGGGLATIAAVRARLPNLPALLITGDTAPDRLREAHAAGVAVLHKPVGAEILQEEISRLLGGAESKALASPASDLRYESAAH
jgi:CheY-like chemotaxis protein